MKRTSFPDFRTCLDRPSPAEVAGREAGLGSRRKVLASHRSPPNQPSGARYRISGAAESGRSAEVAFAGTRHHRSSLIYERATDHCSGNASEMSGAGRPELAVRSSASSRRRRSSRCPPRPIWDECNVMANLARAPSQPSRRVRSGSGTLTDWIQGAYHHQFRHIGPEKCSVVR